MLGYEAEELATLSIPDIHPAESLAMVAAQFQMQLRGEIGVSEDIPVLRRDGTIVYADVNGFPLSIGGKRYQAGIFRDVTRRRAAERALAESEEKYRRLAESTPDIPYEMRIDGILTYIAPQVQRYGLDPAALIGGCFTDAILAEDHAQLGADLARTLTTGETFPSVFRVRNASGDLFWFEERSTLRRDADGHPMALTGVLRDITERKLAEAREQALLQRLQAFEEGVNQGPAVVIRWRIVPGVWPVELISANCRQFGYEAEAFLSGSVQWATELTHPGDVARLEQEVAGYLASGATEFGQQYRLIAKGGEVRQVEDRNTVIRDAEGRPTHIQGVVLDITERRRGERLAELHRQHLRALRAELERVQERERRQIAAGLHDEIGPLLVASRLKLGEIEARLNDSAAVPEVAQIDDLLSLLSAKIRALTFELGVSVFYELGLAEALAELCEKMTAKSAVGFDFEAVDNGQPLKDERALILYRAACELLVNVDRHARATHAQVRLARIDGRAVLSIADNGVGFDATDIGQGVSPTGGFGLFRLREQVNEVGGRLHVDSIPGDGTRLVVEVPLTAEMEEVTDANPHSAGG